MGIKGGRNLRGIEGDPAEEGLYQRVNVTFPPSMLQPLYLYVPIHRYYPYKPCILR